VNPVAIHAFNPGPMTGEGNWTWLIPGARTTLIDAGTGDPRHLDAVQQALGGRRLHQVIVTHGHTDHASGAPALAARFPGVRFYKMSWPERDARWQTGWEAVADGDVLHAGDGELVAVHTPGHAPDHICLLHRESRELFCGDLAIQGSSIYIPSTLGGNLSEYLASLDRVRGLAPRRMFPAHGPIIENPDMVLREYIAHRQEREQQVLQALADGRTTPDAILERIYPGIRPAMVPVARDTIVSHLLKLESDGRVRREAASGGSPTGPGAEAWHIIEP
jgi:glyoxylase-like metal-dependent hydrolase (beta-lactamase superfamily II)